MSLGVKVQVRPGAFRSHQLPLASLIDLLLRARPRRDIEACHLNRLVLPNSAISPYILYILMAFLEAWQILPTEDPTFVRPWQWTPLVMQLLRY